VEQKATLRSRTWSDVEEGAAYTCGKMILVISCFRNFRSYAAAITSDETNEQSVMTV